MKFGKILTTLEKNANKVWFNVSMALYDVFGTLTGIYFLAWSTVCKHLSAKHNVCYFYNCRCLDNFFIAASHLCSQGISDKRKKNSYSLISFISYFHLALNYIFWKRHI